MDRMEKIDSSSLDLEAENIKKLKQLFPSVVSEGKIDFDLLREILGEEVDDRNEKYQFIWNGKKEAIKLAQRPSKATLRPCKKKSIDWDNTENLYIEGDNLEVLKQLQKTYFGKIKMIYIDPPYNTGYDLLYEDDFKEPLANYLEQTNGNMKANPETGGRYHTKWLNMMYPRLLLAKNLLTNDGVIFVSIDDNEQANLKKICDEIFGETSFVTTIHVELSATQGMKVKAAKNGNIVKNAEYILVYSKDGHKNIATEKILFDNRPDYDKHYTKYLMEDDTVVNLKDYYISETKDNISTVDIAYKENRNFREFVENHLENIFRYDKTTGFNTNDFEMNKVYHIEKNGRKYTLQRRNNSVDQMMFLSDSYGYADDFLSTYGLRKIRGDWWKDFYKDMGNVSKEGDTVFENGKKPVRLIKQICKMVTSDDDIILDFFSGSSTTAHAVMQLNCEDAGRRRFIMVQLPEKIDSKDFDNICDLAQSRIKKSSESLNQNLFQEFDGGFKVFKLDTTNIIEWDNEHEIDELDVLLNQIDTFKQDRDPLDILYEIMLKYGIFDMSVNEVIVNDKKMYRIGGRYMIVCLDDEINSEDVKAIGELKPKVVVFKDSGFKNDNVKINAMYNLKNAGVEDVKSI